MALSVVLSNTSGVAIYDQIKTQIRDAILRGDLADGEQLPSIRALARDLRVSVITTTRAYTDLTTERYLANVPGKGYYVRQLEPALAKEALVAEVEAHLSDALTRAKLAGLTASELHSLLDTLLTSGDLA